MALKYFFSFKCLWNFTLEKHKNQVPTSLRTQQRGQVKLCTLFSVWLCSWGGSEWFRTARGKQQQHHTCTTSTVCYEQVLLQTDKSWQHSTSRVPDQNGVSQAWYIVEIYHSGQKPSTFNLNQKRYVRKTNADIWLSSVAMIYNDYSFYCCFVCLEHLLNLRSHHSVMTMNEGHAGWKRQRIVEFNADTTTHICQVWKNSRYSVMNSQRHSNILNFPLQSKASIYACERNESDVMVVRLTSTNQYHLILWQYQMLLLLTSNHDTTPRPLISGTKCWPISKRFMTHDLWFMVHKGQGHSSCNKLQNSVVFIIIPRLKEVCP